MLTKTITVKERGELTVSKSKRTYFIVHTEENEQFICYKSSLHPEFAQGVTQVIEYEEAKTEGYSPSITGIVKETPDQEPTLHPDEPQIDKYAPQEIGMWFKEVGEMIRAGKLSKEKPTHRLLELAYFERMCRVIGIETKKED